MPVELCIAEELHIGPLVVLVLGIQCLEMEAIVSDALVYANCIQNAQGDGEEHDSGALDEAVRADFPDG